MKKWNYMMGCILLAFTCFPAVVLAASEEPQGGRTDVYVGVTTVTKSNMKFLVVDEGDTPIDGASIDIWANEALKYQLLGVSHDGGIYETAMPYGTYPYQVYKTGYETTAGELVLPGRESPHIEKVVLKKEQKKDPNGSQENGNPSGGSTDGIKRTVKTGDNAKVSPYILLAGISMMLVLIVCCRRRRAAKNR